MDDESYLKYSNYSEINICHTASLGTSASPNIPYEYAPPQPPPEPPPNTPIIHVTDVHPHKYNHDESIQIEMSYVSDIDSSLPTTTPDTSHLLWSSYILCYLQMMILLGSLNRSTISLQESITSDFRLMAVSTDQ